VVCIASSRRCRMATRLGVGRRRKRMADRQSACGFNRRKLSLALSPARQPPWHLARRASRLKQDLTRLRRVAASQLCSWQSHAGSTGFNGSRRRVRNSFYTNKHGYSAPCCTSHNLISAHWREAVARTRKLQHLPQRRSRFCHAQRKCPVCWLPQGMDHQTCQAITCGLPGTAPCTSA